MTIYNSINIGIFQQKVNIDKTHYQISDNQKIENVAQQSKNQKVFSNTEKQSSRSNAEKSFLNKKIKIYSSPRFLCALRGSVLNKT